MSGKNIHTSPKGVTGAVSGSGVFPPTTQSGSFTASPAPVQASNPKEKVSVPSTGNAKKKAPSTPPTLVPLPGSVSPPAVSQSPPPALRVAPQQHFSGIQSLGLVESSSSSSPIALTLSLKVLSSTASPKPPRRLSPGLGKRKRSPTMVAYYAPWAKKQKQNPDVMKVPRPKRLGDPRSKGPSPSLRKLEAQEMARQVKMMRKLEMQALVRAAKEARQQTAIIAAKERRKQKEQIRILKQQENIKRIQQIRMEKELRAQELLEERERERLRQKKRNEKRLNKWRKLVEEGDEEEEEVKKVKKVEVYDQYDVDQVTSIEELEKRIEKLAMTRRTLLEISYCLRSMIYQEIELEKEKHVDYDGLSISPS